MLRARARRPSFPVSALVVTALATTGAACTTRDPPPPKRDTAKASAWKEVKTPVPVGTKIGCDKLLAAEPLSVALGRPLRVVEKKGEDPDATSVCQLVVEGKPPSERQQKRMADENDLRLGVLPGDELCLISAYCEFHFDPADTKKRCEATGEGTSTEIGLLTCVREIQAGDRFRYVVSAIDPDTRCKIAAASGPSVTDEAVVKACARAAVDAIGPAQLAAAP